MKVFNGYYEKLDFPNEFSEEDMNQYKGQMVELVHSGKKAVLLDFSHIDFIHSRGVSLLIQDYKFCRENHVYLALLHAGEGVRRILSECRLQRVLKIFENEKEFDIPDSEALEKMQPVDFYYHSHTTRGAKLLICVGILSITAAFLKFLEELRLAQTVILDFSHLSFIEFPAIDKLVKACANSKVYLCGVNEIVTDELRYFEVQHHFVISSSLSQVIRNLEAPE